MTDSDQTEESTETRRTSRTLIYLSIVAVVVVVVAGGALAYVSLSSVNRSETVEVVVPAGTGERMDAGEDIELLPAYLELDVGDRLVINNNDDRIHTVGPYVVAPGQTIAQTFSEPGRIEGACTLHPSGAVTIVVT